MKWRIQLAYFITVSAQMTVLLAAWWLKLLIDGPWPMLTALLVLSLGVIGGVVTAHIKRGNYTENSKAFWWVNILGSIITTAGIFIVFFPVMGLLFHSTITAVTFVLGFLAPMYMPYFINRSGTASNA